MEILPNVAIIAFLALNYLHFADGIYRSYTHRKLAQYSRAYDGINLGVFTYYHNYYFTYARLRGYSVKYQYYSSRKCGNFEANSYGDYIGFFSCPLLSSEWPNASYCCGYQGSHYCCDSHSKDSSYTSDPFDNTFTIDLSWTTYIGIAFGALFGIGLLIAGIWFLAVFCGVKNRKKVKHNRVNAVTIQSVQGSYPTQPGTGGEPVPMGAYPTQPMPTGVYPPQPFTVQPPPAYSSQLPPSYSQIESYPPAAPYPATGPVPAAATVPADAAPAAAPVDAAYPPPASQYPPPSVYSTSQPQQ